ncbi:MAG TPA: glucose 1-dehydrogenase [Stellaceae bacterium]|nr:glucose 1-dehydrogenase [Stellaceae bacterium]
MAELSGKIAIVTGGSSGIGRATVQRFVEEGARVVIADIADRAGEDLAAALGESAVYKRTDVSKSADVEAVVAFAVSRFGDLDIMFNNAGLPEKKPEGLIDNDLSEFEKVMAVDALGPALGIRFAGRYMREKRKGVIINTASTAGFYSGYAVPIYRAAKAAVIALTQNAAVELGASGVRVNAISPGPIETPMFAGDQFTPEVTERINKMVTATLIDMQLLRRVGRPIDIANAVVFLASDRAAQITGHNLIVDGGASVGDKVDRNTLMQKGLAEIIGGA